MQDKRLRQIRVVDVELVLGAMQLEDVPQPPSLELRVRHLLPANLLLREAVDALQQSVTKPLQVRHLLVSGRQSRLAQLLWLGRWRCDVRHVPLLLVPQVVDRLPQALLAALQDVDVPSELVQQRGDLSVWGVQGKGTGGGLP